MLPFRSQSMVLGRGAASVAFLTGSVDPTLGAGVPAALGSLYWQLATATAWKKVGPADNAWRPLGLATPIAPRDPVYDHQFIAQMGAPASTRTYLAYLTIANQTTSPLYPIVGQFPMTTVGTPVFGAAGPSAPLGDPYSKAVQFTDGQAAAITSPAGTLIIGPRATAIGVIARLDAVTPAGNRALWGYNSTDDYFIQERANGSLWLVIVDGGVTTTVQLNVAHNDGVWFAAMGCIAGGNARMASNRGAGTPVVISPDIATTTAWQIGQNGGCPPGRIHTVFGFVSDGTPAGDAAMLDLYTNAVLYCSNLLAALVTP